jgi:glutamyl endopeptidase
MSQRTNGGHAETMSEMPTMEQFQRQKQKAPFTAIGQTEVEEVEGGYTLLKPEEANREISNVFDEEELSRREAVLEEPGTEVGTEESQPLDALFASYGDLLVQVQQTQPEFGELSEELEGRIPVKNPNTYPFRAVCRLIITARDNTRWYGTGFLVAPRTVITAGHCVFLHEHGGWAKSIEVIPGLNKESRPHGSAVARIFKTVVGWTKGKNRNQDYAAIILPQRSRLGDSTGTFGFAVMQDEMLNTATLNLADYPIIQHTRQAFRKLQQQQGVFAGQYSGEFQQSEGQEGLQEQEGQLQQFEEQGPSRLKQGLLGLSNQLWFTALHVRSVSTNQIRYDQAIKRGQSGAPVWIKTGNNRYVVGIHSSSYLTGFAAIRITQAVFNNLSNWKAFGI